MNETMWVRVVKNVTDELELRGHNPEAIENAIVEAIEEAIEDATECISCSAPAPLVAPETGDRWCQRCWDAAGEQGEA